jgi:hypothetical protein
MAPSSYCARACRSTSVRSAITRSSSTSAALSRLMSSRSVTTARASLRPSAFSSVATTSCCSRYAAALRPADRQVHGRHSTLIPA